MHPCRLCNQPQKIYFVPHALQNHLRKDHSPPTRPYTQTNTALLNSTFAHNPLLHSRWNTALPWLFDLELSPPPFRSSTFSRLSGSCRTNVLNTLGSVISLIVKATSSLEPTPDNEPAPAPHETTSSPFWKLLFLYEALICQPERSQTALIANVNRRLKLFRAGHIQTLHEEMMSHPSTKPSTHACQADIDEWNELIFGIADPSLVQRYNPGAQAAANRDNLHAAAQRLDGSLPVALNTDQTVTVIQNTLYPPPVPNSPYDAPQERAKPSSYRCGILKEDNDLLAAIRHIKTGTSPGPFADSTDLLRSFALVAHRTNDKDKEFVYPHLKLFRAFITILHDADIPSDIIRPFGSQYFLALHKDVEDDTKLRPIAIGTNARRILGVLEAYHHAGEFASTLWPFQFGIAINAGMQLLTHSFIALMDRFLPGSPIASTRSRAFFLFDIRNMFNATSRLSSRHGLQTDGSDLLPVFDLLYHDTNTCWYKRPDGSWGSFLQQEGFAQGCPLSPFFACRVLHKVLRTFHDRLQRRADARLAAGDTGDDGKGSAPALGSYLDDTGALVPYVDCLYALETFAELGRPHGLILNFDKTKVLTTLDPNDPAANLFLARATSLLKPSNILTSGVKYLGSPLGSPAFVNAFLMQKADDLEATRISLQAQLTDLQTQTVLFIKCFQTTVSHLLGTDVLLRAQSALHPIDPFNWTSPFLSKLNDTTTKFLAYLTHHPTSAVKPGTIAWFLAHVPTSSGGIGLQDYAARAVACFAVPLARSIRSALKGAPAHRSDTILRMSDSLASGLRDWQTSLSPCFATLRSLVPPLLAHEDFKMVDDVTSHFVLAIDLASKIRDLTRKFKRRSLKNFQDSVPPALAIILPSLLERYTSEALLQMSRRCRDHRLPTPYFRLLLCRKLRLPVYTDPSRPSHCGCGKKLDIYGDHFFACQRYHSKSMIHNRLRDALAYILSQIGTHAGLIRCGSDVTCEPRGLCAAHPTSRPADVHFPLTPTYVSPPTSPFAKAAIDVRVTHLPPLPSGDSSNTGSVTKTHQKAEREKFEGPNVNTSSTFINGELVIRALNEANIVFLPFIVDPLGGLGPIARNFLYGIRPKPVPPPLSFQTNPTAQTAYDNATSAASPIGILHHADVDWLKECAHLPFGNTYHSWFPSTWARQILGANCNFAFASHLHASIHRTYKEPSARAVTPDSLALGRFSRFAPAAFTGSFESLKQSARGR